MTPRERALILRLAAIAETGEWGAQNLRRILRDLGWTDAAMNTAVARARAVLADVSFTQAELFERAA